MNLGFGMPTSAFAPAIEARPQKRNWQSRLYDKFMPQGEGLLAVDDDDKKAMVRQGLLSLAAGIQSSRNFGEGLTQGLQGGLLAMNQGADNIADRRMKQQYMAQQMGAPSEFRAVDAIARAAGFTPGSEGYKQFMRVHGGIEGRASSAGIGFEKITGADGRERIGRTNPRTGAFEVYDETTGDFVPMGNALPTGGAQQSMPGVYIDPTLPPYVREQIAQAESSGQQVPSLITNMPQPRNGNPALGVSMSPQEKAFAEENARQQAQLGVLPRRTEIEALGAGAKAAAEAAAKTQAEVAAKFGQRERDATQTLDLLNEAEQILPSATGSGAGAALDQAGAFFGHSTPGAQATARLNLIASQLVAKVPRFEGPQSDKDTQFYKEAAGDLANPSKPVETRLAALRTLRALNEKYAGGVQPQPAAPAKRLKFNPKTGRIE